MHFGEDFFKICKFIIMVLKLLGQIFGDDDDRIQADIHINGLDPKPNHGSNKIDPKASSGK